LSVSPGVGRSVKDSDSHLIVWEYLWISVPVSVRDGPAAPAGRRREAGVRRATFTAVQMRA